MIGGQFVVRRKKVKKSQSLLLTLFVVFALGTKAQDKLPLKLIATTPLPDLVGDLEFFAPDLKGNRLFLCAENSKTVEVFDLHTGKRIHTITGFGEPHDIVYLPDSNKLVVTDGGDDFGWVELVSGENYQIVDKIKLPNAVDEAVFDPVNQYFYVESGSDEPGGKTHLINIIDAKNFKLVGTITLPGKNSNAMAVDHTADKLYVNNSGTSEIVVVNLKTREIIARWPLPEAHGLNGLSFDPANHRLFSATRSPAKFWVLDTDTGKIVTSLPCTDYNDHMMFDAARKRIYITGTEVATVIEQRDADHYEHVAEVPTGYRSKTSILVPELNRVYVALSGKDMSGKPLLKPGVQMAIKIYEVQP
jgi:DNA-binding beta-propeller fold protein YncE